MATITSVSNQRVKYVRTLSRRQARHDEGCFVVEGKRLVADALRAGARLRMAFYTEDATDVELLDRLRAATPDSFAVTPAVMGALSDTVTPQGIVAVAEFPQWPQPGAPSRIGLILDQWRDPGNLGTAFRVSEAAGVDWVILTPGTVDPFSPKVVRAGMGAHFRLPVFVDWEWDDILRALKGVPLYLADARAAVTYDQVDWTQPSALIVGGEAFGPGDETQRIGAVKIAVPMEGGAESLNAAVAASVILMEASQQRRRRR
jgi:TrmH family RNA methyltransferase